MQWAEWSGSNVQPTVSNGLLTLNRPRIAHKHRSVFLEVELVAVFELRKIYDNVVALGHAHSESAWNDRRSRGIAITGIRACVDRNRMLEEVSVGRDHSYR